MTYNQVELEHERAELISSLPTRAPIYLPTSKIPLDEQVQGLRDVRYLYRYGMDTMRDRLRSLRDRFHGHRRAFIIGNGPSLNDTDLSLLRDEVTFCMNGFFLKMPELDWVPTFHVVEDHLVAEDRASAINHLTGPIKLYPAYLRYCIEEGRDTIFFNHLPRISYPHTFDFSTEADKVTYTGCTVTFTCMQLAHWLGFEEIYLIGVDASYKIPADAQVTSDYGTSTIDMASDDPNHFDPDYFGKGYRWHDPQVDKMIEAYAVARDVCDAAGRPIKNATKGGQLEVFERVRYEDLFRTPSRPPPPLDARSKTDLPKVAVIDATPFGQGTATGELKTALFENWRDHKVLTISSAGYEYLALADKNDEPVRRSFAEVRRRLRSFQPDVIVYRPLPDKPVFHKMAQALLRGSTTPLVTWTMDNWLARLEQENPPAGREMARDLASLYTDAARNLSISEDLSRHLAERFGVGFTAVANGVNAADWDFEARKANSGPTIRYAGGLSPHMNLDTLLCVADAVEQMDHPCRFEIKTRDHWANLHGRLFDDFTRTLLTTDELPMPDYRRWLSSADIVLVPYNFDQFTRRYVEYSMANKLPECLASGAAVVGIGPDDFSAIKALGAAPGVTTITSQTEIALTLTDLVGDRERFQGSGALSRAYALRAHRLDEQQNWFQQVLSDAARSPKRAASRWGPLHLGTSGPIKRIARFYGGRRGILPATALFLMALPVLSAETLLEVLLSLCPPAGLALALVMIGNWFSQLR